MAKVRVLGLDPGTARTGYGLVIQDGSAQALVECGLLTTPAGQQQSQRLADLQQQLTTVLAKLKPDEVAIERLFFANNAKTAMQVAEARGVLMAASHQAGLAVSEYTPLQVKQAVTAHGQADKKQVATMVVKLLQLKETPKPDDVTDAIAVALCHQQWRKMPKA